MSDPLRRIVLVLGLLSVVGVAAAALVADARRPVLEPTADLEIVEADGAGRLLATIPSGGDIEVLHCRDDKHSLVPIVRIGSRLGEPKGQAFKVSWRKVSILSEWSMTGCS